MRLIGVATALTVLLAGCSGDTDGGDDKVPNSPESAPTTSTGSGEIDQMIRIPCENAGQGDGSHAGQSLIDNAVILPAATNPISTLVPVAESGVAYSAALLPEGSEWSYAKHGLQVRAGQRVQIEVSSEYVEDMRIGWGGSPSEPTDSVLIENCSTRTGLLQSEWLVFAGGYWVRRAGCYALDLKINDGEIQRIEVAIGEQC